MNKRILKITCLVAALLLPGAISNPGITYAKDNPSGWIARATATTDIRQKGMPPFRLTARVELFGTDKKPFDGTYELIWKSPHQWREEIQFPGYSRIRVGDTGAYWLKRNVPYEIPRVSQLDDLIDGPLYLRNWLSLAKTHHPHTSTGKLNCVDLKTKQGHFVRENCYDQKTGALAQVRFKGDKYDPLAVTRWVYSDFQPWHGKIFPNRMRAYTGKAPVIDVSVRQLFSNATVPPSTFAHSSGFGRWANCGQQARFAKLIYSPKPKYPERAREEHIQGTVWIHAVIDEKGAVTNPRIVAAVSPDLDKAAMEAISRWRYAPTVCNGHPVPVQTMIRVTFLIGG